MEAPLTNAELDALKTKMQQHGQIDLLRHWESLSDTEQKALYADLGVLDFGHLRRIFDASNQVDTTDLKHVQPAQDVVTLADMSAAQRKQWTATGLQLIAEVCVSVSPSIHLLIVHYIGQAGCPAACWRPGHAPGQCPPQGLLRHPAPLAQVAVPAAGRAHHHRAAPGRRARVWTRCNRAVRDVTKWYR